MENDPEIRESTNETEATTGLSTAYFSDGDILVMKQCLEAVVSNRHLLINAVGDDVYIVTGRRVAEFAAVLERFDRLKEFSREDFEIVFQAVLHLPHYPIGNRDELAEKTRISLISFDLVLLLSG